MKIVVLDPSPYDGPIYTYYVQGEGDTWSYAFMETQEYAWEQNDAYSYRVRLGLTNDFAGVAEWNIEGATQEGASVYFVGDGDSKLTTYDGMEANIKFTEAQTQPFKLKVTIYADADKTEVLSGVDWGQPITYDETTQYFIVIPVQSGHPAIRSISVNSDDASYYEPARIAPEESATVNFYAGIRGEQEERPVTNADVTWSLVNESGSCSFEITEGDADGNAAAVTHTCDSETCDKTGAVQVMASYDPSYGSMTGISDFYIISADYAGDLSFDSDDEEEGDEDDTESSLAMTFSSDPGYEDNGDGTASVEISKNSDGEAAVWNLWSCSAGEFTLMSSDSRVTTEPYDDNEDNRNIDMNILIPAEVTEDFTVTATSMDCTKSVTFYVVMTDAIADVSMPAVAAALDQVVEGAVATASSIIESHDE